MSTIIRPMKRDDVGRIAYLMLKWDAELPRHLQRLKGDAVQAEIAASAFASGHPNFIARVLEVDGKIVGGIGIHVGTSIFSPHPYGQLICWFVDKEYRGGKLYGLRLLKEAMKITKETKALSYLEVYPWSDDVNTCGVLERLGFFKAVDVYVGSA